ncbi:MGH1-like glycoside hydrolase domain-containing protein [Leucothrix mucor]|uniref:MGH1-like glycoside hydrolase domain-containing protein n=1 Tax=Leucothrix mucor TaxID=45248 RepID=UPI0003B767CE|nr:glucosidase [Leucothrix mucor]
MSTIKNAEQQRLNEHYSHEKKWLEWGPYLSERQWGTVREDYSPDGEAWDYFPHEHARSRTYRWGEDGIAGISDRHCAVCFAVTLWNGNDPYLKERLYGLTGPQGNHGEDCKELYYYLDSTPTHSYMKHLYKYPQQAYPYQDLLETNQQRNRQELEYEILDTGVFDDNRYFDVFTEYAKADEEDILVKITVHNRGPEAADITVLPTLWLRNLWSFGQTEREHNITKNSENNDFGSVKLTHPKLGDYYLAFDKPEQWLFTENETNKDKLYGQPNATPYVKDLFHDAVVGNDFSLTQAVSEGSKFAPMFQQSIDSQGHIEIRLRFSKQHYTETPLTNEFDAVFALRQQEADAFYAPFCQKQQGKDAANIQRQAFAGMLWSKQYYNIDMETWIKGDPGQTPPPKARKKGRNKDWMTLNNEDIISMPDKWEYPWYAVWDLAFHTLPLAMIDPEFAKKQLIMVLHEWYMAPSGQIPAYEWHFSDVNPPVHAWAAYKVYEIDKKKTGKGDITFLKRVFNKLSLNFTWWVNQKDRSNNNVFEGGFLGLDNIGVFDRSKEIPGGGHLEQADGTAWMAMFSLNMLQIALEISTEDNAYEDMCTKYFEHFVYISESLNKMGHDWVGNWDESEGFFYDILALPKDQYIPIKVRSLVGLMTLNSVLVLEREKLDKVKSFYAKLKWFFNYRRKHNKYRVLEELKDDGDLLLSLVPKQRLKKLLSALLDENEFLSDYGIRSLSKRHSEPYNIHIEGQHFSVQYDPAESTTNLFGGNSNWRGPIWIPMNFLFVQSLMEYHKYYGDEFTIDCAINVERNINLKEVSDDINQRLVAMFRKDAAGNRPIHALHKDTYSDEHFEDLILFYEYFHGDNGRGVGATHQTGWTGCVAYLLDGRPS